MLASFTARDLADLGHRLLEADRAEPPRERIVAAPTRAKPCRCIGRLVVADEDGVRCTRCGREPREGST